MTERPVEGKKVRVEPSPSVLFAGAEQAFAAGDLDKALQEYGRFLDGYPRDPNAPVALARMARIHETRDDPKTAVELLRRLLRNYPFFPELHDIQFALFKDLTRLGKFEEARTEALVWLNQYPEDPRRADVMEALGDVQKVARDSPQALLWWVRARDAATGDPAQRERLEQKILMLINQADLKDLPLFTPYAGDAYAAPIYYRMALLYLEQKDTDRARAAAYSLIRATPDDAWVAKGRALLDQMAGPAGTTEGKWAVGCLLPLSGPMAMYGQEVLNGVMMGSGLLGDEASQGPIAELDIKDTAGDPAKALEGIEALAARKDLIAVIGPVGGTITVPAAQKAQALGVPIITLTQSDGVTGLGEWVFRNFLTPAQEIHSLVETAIAWGLYRFAVLYPRTPYGERAMNLFVENAQKMGGTVAVVESYSPQDTDFSGPIRRMGGNGTRIAFDAVFIPDNTQGIALIAPQFPYYNIRQVRLLGTSPWQSPDLLKQAGEFLQGALFTSGFFDKSRRPGTDAFVAGYEAAFGSRPGVLAATGSDTIGMLLTLLKTGEVRDRAGLVKTLRAQTYEGLTGKTVFGPNGAADKSPLVLTISGSEIKELP